ncbi:hypothetical protein CPT_Muldoon_107 [Serratia phage Muldoon]|uniref:Uncharacterized protein n=1 Tax=Serratia phage Muldoon TaxID=2601678 RepID=A0A5P8PH80_9CAUD|nr:hypothetical protein HYP94_gp106 [Serratia phage Muldoon]QFR56062.1 hypothetical protein CPT_Muldoon_107 [Serratia phage Muldoon]
MIYYEGEIGENPIKLTRKKFEKIFGITYQKFCEEEHCKIQFKDGFCAIDPFIQDVRGREYPLVALSIDQLRYNVLAAIDDI